MKEFLYKFSNYFHKIKNHKEEINKLLLKKIQDYLNKIVLFSFDQ